MDDDEEFKDDRPRRGARRRGPGGLLIFLIVIVLAVVLFSYGNRLAGQSRIRHVTLGEFMKQVELSTADKPGQRRITQMSVDGYEVTAKMKYTEGKEEFEGVRTEFPKEYFEKGDALDRLKTALDDPAKFEYNQPNLLFRDFILQLIPWLLIVVFVWFFFFRPLRSTGGTGNVLNFGRSKARFVTPEKVKVSFKDVAGVDEAKQDVKELVDFLKNPKKFRRLGGRIPRGILLVGPPGTGKTLLAKAIAGEAGVPFFSICGSDFVEMFVGVGASRVRDLFRQAREHSPAIIFLDEIDAVGRRRGSGLGGGHDEREQTLNQILVEMDGFDTDESVIVVAATNRPDILDPALLRPGRFDRQVAIDLPDVHGRQEILGVHIKKIKTAPELDLSVLARTTPGASGADLAAIINEAAIIGTMRNRESVSLEDLEEARDKVLFGRERKSRVMDEKERQVTAYHEGGHAILAQLLAPVANPVHKVTIVPRGLALGATMQLPERDKYIIQRSSFEAQMIVLYGGRVAEEIFFGDISSGARDDIQKATLIARQMVCELGMSSKMGPVAYSDPEEHLFLGREITRTRPHSEQTAEQIDHEMKGLIDRCYQRARDLITENKDRLEKIAAALLKYEVLSGQEIKMLMQGEDIEALRNGQLLKNS